MGSTPFQRRGVLLLVSSWVLAGPDPGWLAGCLASCSFPEEKRNRFILLISRCKLMSSRLCVAQNFLPIAEVCVKIIFKRYKHNSFYNNTILHSYDWQGIAAALEKGEYTCEAAAMCCAVCICPVDKHLTRTYEVLFEGMSWKFQCYFTLDNENEEGNRLE